MDKIAKPEPVDVAPLVKKTTKAKPKGEVGERLARAALKRPQLDPEQYVIYVRDTHLKLADDAAVANFEALIRYLTLTGCAHTYDMDGVKIYRFSQTYVRKQAHDKSEVEVWNSCEYSFFHYHEDRTVYAIPKQEASVVVARSVFLEQLRNPDKMPLVNRHNGWRFLLAKDVKIEGLHFGELFTPEECDVQVFTDAYWGACWVIVYKTQTSEHVMFFPQSDAELNVSAKRLTALREAYHISTTSSMDVLQDAWINRYARSVQKAQKEAEAQVKQLRAKLAQLNGSLAQLRQLTAAMQGSVSKQIDAYRAAFASAGMTFTAFNRKGMLFRTGPLFVDIGGHDTASDPRYLGDYAVLVTPEGGCAIRNLASPGDVNHPYFSEHGMCIGNYEDILNNCLQLHDHAVFAMTVLAMLGHFDEGRRSFFIYLPKEQPAQTYVTPGWVDIYGSVIASDGTDADEDDEGEDD